MLAIMWTNEFDPLSNHFDDHYSANATIARQLVNRAIDDWEAVITDFRYDTDNNPATNNTFNLTVIAAPVSGRGTTNTTFNANGKPTHATVTLDDNGGGIGWFFDQTPLDDAEFTAIANSGFTGTEPSFHGSFVDVNGGHSDFYRTIVHEIGHAMGLASSSPVFAVTSQWMTHIGADPSPNDPFDQLYSFHKAGSQFGVTATLTTNGGRHLYEVSHPNDLMNPGRVTPVGISFDETTRQLISDWNVKLLADAYNYSVFLPSTFNTMHATLDSQTGTLLVQGGLNSQGQSRDDTINVDVVGSNIRVQVNGTTELFPSSNVSQIVIAGNGGQDIVTWATAALSALGLSRKDVGYVVSSNQDPLTVSDTNGDGFVDHDTAVPGRQTSLRGAVADIYGITAGSSIYVPRGAYKLTTAGSAGFAQGDIDLDRKTIIIGSGAGATIIDGSTLATRDRIFETLGTGSLDLSRVTLTGGRTNLDGGAIRVNDNPTAGVLELALREVAIVGNVATDDSGFGSGGGIYVAPVADALIYRSVVTNNTAEASSLVGGGGGIYAGGGAAGTVITLTQSVIAKNAAVGNLGPDLLSINPGVFLSQGNNMFTNVSGATFSGGLAASDYRPGSVGYVAPSHIVTSVADSYDMNSSALSVREAVDAANSTTALDHVWLPAWKFLLTRERTALPNQTELDVAQGDIEVEESLVLRGVASVTSVKWRAGAAADALFDLLGDYNNSLDVDYNNVSAADYTLWQSSYSSGVYNPNADGNDDGVVDADDYLVWDDHFGNTLTLLNVTA